MLRKIFFIVLVLALGSCSKQDLNYSVNKIKRDPVDREANLTRQEIKSAARPYDNPYSKELYKGNEIGYGASAKKRRGSHSLKGDSFGISPSSLPIRNNKKVTLSVTEDVPLKDLLVQIAQLAELELALDPGITGGVILSVKQRPVSEVIELIADLGLLRYRVKNGVLYVSKDLPYLENYKVDFINLVRSGKSKLNSQTQVLSIDTGAEDDNSDAFNSGSSNEITSEYGGDLWASIEINLEAILQTQIQSLSTLRNSQAIRDQLLSDLDVASASSTDPNSNLSTAELIAQNAAFEQQRSFYTVNKQAGIVSVMTTQRKHKEIAKYLEKIKLALSTQVLIEAKLIEISLGERFGSGVNWGNLKSNEFVVNLDTQQNAGDAFSKTLLSNSSGIFRATEKTTDPIAATLNLIEDFGTVRTLSNFRVNALNNQQAVMTYATNQPYFTVSGTLQQQTTTTTDGTVIQPVSVTSTLRTIPIGLILTLQPSINLETDEVTISIRPTLSSSDFTTTDTSVKDPAITILNNSLTNTTSQTIEDPGIPIVRIKELDTMLTVKSGDVIVLGGLIDHKDITQERGVPFVSRIPIIGNLTKQVYKATEVVETVMLLQATIVPSGTSHYHNHDKMLYEQLAQDPIPFDL